jgi:diguanylate cyclase (GGDEF)-like protein/PAS domain S-box-containing protein
MHAIAAGYPAIAEQEWRLAFDAAPHGIAFVELDGRITHVNRSLCALLGYPPEVLRSYTFTELTHPDDRHVDADNLIRMLCGEFDRYTREKRYRHANGSWVWVNRSMGLVRNPVTGEPVRWVSTFEDVSERIATAAASERAIALQRSIIAAQTAIGELLRDKEALRREICSRAMALTGGTGAVLELAEGEDLVCRAAAGDLELHIGSRFTADGSIAPRAMIKGVGLLCGDTETDPRVRRELARRLGVRSLLVVPLHAGGEVVGALKVVAPEPHFFGAEELRALELLSAPFAAALRNADDLELSATRALTDPLTGLANRSGALAALRRALASSSGRTAVLFLDLDGFKAVNDERGHGVGDQVLTEVASRIRATIRRADTGARFGGDEFVVIASSLGSDLEADVLASRLVSAITAPYSISGVNATVGVSVGIALASSPASLADLIDAADAAMYDAKHRGGSQHTRMIVS